MYLHKFFRGGAILVSCMFHFAKKYVKYLSFTLEVRTHTNLSLEGLKTCICGLSLHTPAVKSADKGKE